MTSPSIRTFSSGIAYSISSCQIPLSAVAPHNTPCTVSAVEASADNKAKQVKLKLQVRKAKRALRTGSATRSLMGSDFEGLEGVGMRCLGRTRQLIDTKVEASKKVANQRNANNQHEEPQQELVNTVLVAAGGEDNDGNRGHDNNHNYGRCGNGNCGNNANNESNGDSGINGKDDNADPLSDTCPHSWDDDFKGPSDTCMPCKYCIYDLWHFSICRHCPLVSCVGCQGPQPGPNTRVKCGRPCCPGGGQMRRGSN